MIDLKNKLNILKKAIYIFSKGNKVLSSWLIAVPTARQSLMLVKSMCAMTIVACVMHLFLGANPVVVLIAGLTFLLSLYPIAIFGFLNMGAVLTALLGFRYAGFPIFAKLVFGQALDTYLYTPMGSFGVTLLGFLGYFIAFRSAEHLSLGKPLLRSSSSHFFLGRVSVLAAIIGITANLIVAFRVDEQYTGATIANFFISFIYLAIISGIARIIIKSKGRQSIDVWVIVLFAIQIEFAMVLNSRMAIMEVFLCWIATTISFEAKLRWRHLIITVSAIVLMNTFITPVFLYLRDFRSELSWTQRTSVAIETAKNWHDAVDHHMEWKELAERRGWYRNYYGSPQTVLERMSHINNVDMLKNAQASQPLSPLENS